MFNAFKSFSIVLAACIAFASCKKEVANEPAGNTSETITGLPDAQSYYATPNGETYTYVDTTAGGSASTSISSQQRMGDTTINEQTFDKVTGDGSSIYNYQSSKEGVTTLVSFNGKEKITTTVLKANEPVGTLWTDNFTTGGVPTTYEWKIVEKGISRTVLGVSYNNVIKVHLNGTAILGAKAVSAVIANADYYYAPNVGLIENIGYNPASGVVELHRVFQKKSK